MPTLLRRKSGKSGKPSKAGEPVEAAATEEKTSEDTAAAETAAADTAVEETAAEETATESGERAADKADAEEAGAEAETEASRGGESTARRSLGAVGRLPRPAVQVLGLLIVVALVLSVSVGVLAFRVADQRAAEEAGPKALNQAKSSVQQLLSYDYRTIESDLANGKSLATGDFRKEWERDAPRLLQVAQENQTVLQTVPMTAAVSSATADEVVVLVFATQASTTAKDTRTKLGTPRLRVTMRLVGDKWLIARLQRL